MLPPVVVPVVPLELPDELEDVFDGDEFEEELVELPTESTPAGLKPDEQF